MALAGSDKKLGQDMYTMARAAMGPAPNPEADVQLKKLCSAFSTAIINHLLLVGQVAVGQITIGSPSTQVTSTPGKFM